MELWDFGSGGGDLAEGFNLRSTSPFPLPEDGEERRGRPRKKRVRNRAARLLLNFTEARVYGTQTARKIDSLNLKMCPEKLLVYSLAALLLPLAGEKATPHLITMYTIPVAVAVSVRSALRRNE